MNMVTQTLYSLQQDLTTCHLSDVTNMFVSKIGRQRERKARCFIICLYITCIIDLKVAHRICQIMK